MDYKEKYEQALERAKNGESLENIFPELQESEDERIRKLLLNGMRYLSEKNLFFAEVSKDKVIAWLEKQDNSYIKWNKNTKDCKPKAKHCVLMKTTHGIAEGEWCGSNQWLQYRWKAYVNDSDVIGWMELSVLEKQDEQEQHNSKWTELTWKDINTIEEIINNVYYDFRNGIGEESFGKEVLERFRETKGEDYMDTCEQKPTWGEIVDIIHDYPKILEGGNK